MRYSLGGFYFANVPIEGIQKINNVKNQKNKKFGSTNTKVCLSTIYDLTTISKLTSKTPVATYKRLRKTQI